MTVPGQHPKIWTPEQAAIAAQIWQDHFVDVWGDDMKAAPQRAVVNAFRRIGVDTGRGYESAWNRYNHFGPSFGAHQTSRSGVFGKVSPHALAAMAARKEAENRQSATSRLLGEPPPGYSALDRRKQEDARA